MRWLYDRMFALIAVKKNWGVWVKFDDTNAKQQQQENKQDDAKIVEDLWVTRMIWYSYDFILAINWKMKHVWMCWFYVMYI